MSSSSNAHMIPSVVCSNFCLYLTQTLKPGLKTSPAQPVTDKYFSVNLNMLRHAYAVVQKLKQILVSSIDFIIGL